MLFDTNNAYNTNQIETLRKLWEQIVEYLSLHHNHAYILSFLGSCGVVAIDEKHKKLEIGVPNEFVLGQAKKFFAKSLKSAVQMTYNQQFSYDFIIFKPFQSKKRDALQIDIQKFLKITPKEVLPQQEEIPAPSQSQISSFGYTLQSQLTFDNLVSGSNIEFALSAARTVADKPWQAYSPLFIYGHAGLGKTHLLNAIGNAIHKYHKNKNILFLPTTQLIDRIVMGIRKNTLPSVLARFKKVDVLLLDDIQFLGNADRTQEIFLNIFNEMQQSGKQIVFTSDKAPRELNSIEARLRSRFSLGLVSDITEPDFETRLAILQSKIALRGHYIDDEFLKIIAETITSNVRELEWAINILLTRKQLTNKDTTLDDVHSCLRTLGYQIKGEETVSLEEMNSLNSRSIMSFWTIVEYVAAYYNLSIADLKSDKRTRDISLARQMLMMIAKQRFGWTYEKIGNYFGGKNHAAVIYAVKHFPKKLKKDPSLNHDYTIVLEQIE